MRDPQGRIEIAGDRALRKLVEPLPPDHFLRRPAARALVDSRAMLDFEFLDDRTLSAPRVAWVSQPSEWCATQLLDAAALTLDVAEQALAESTELKDASAWNVLFDGARPVFCDHLSFAPIVRREWRALGQFARHFSLPLAVARLRGLPVNEQFRMYRDGMSPALARSLCAWRRFGVVAGMLMSRRHAKPAADAAHDAAFSGTPYHANLLRFARWTLPARAASSTRSTWNEYTTTRAHYDDDSLAFKKETVERWIARLRPGWVLDLGCNTGEFSLLAADAGARVISIDADLASIEQLYRDAGAGRHRDAIHPVVARLEDLQGARGWAATESPGLDTRLAGCADTVLMLALLHHLMLAGAIPADAVAAFAARVTRRDAIVELIGESDPMFAALTAHYDRRADAVRACGRDAQLAAFVRHFDVVETAELPRTPRALVLLRRKESVA